MRRRIYELREVERIMGMLEGEIKYRKNPLGQSFRNISVRCSSIYGKWLFYVAELMSDGSECGYHKDGEDDVGCSTSGDSGETDCNVCADGGFMGIWNQGLDWLGRQGGRICIRQEDIDSFKYMGQALAEGDVDTQINALILEKNVLENRITELSNEVKNKSRIAVSLCGLGGILMVICLAL